MKRYLFIISLLLNSFFCVAQIDNNIGIWDVFEDNYLNYIPSTGVLDSRNGYKLSPTGQIRFLVAFIELEYNNPANDPSLNGTPEWPVGQLPSWKDDFKIQTIDGVFQQPDVIIHAINQKLGNSFVTAHGFSSISDFDTWTTTGEGETKPNTGNNKWDFVLFIFRNSNNPANSNGYSSPSNLALLGHSIDAPAWVCSNSIIPTQVIRHEYAHQLLGRNNFHTGGGGWGEREQGGGGGNYWIPQIGGWGLLGLYGCSLWTWSAWDRYRLGWTGTNNL